MNHVLYVKVRYFGKDAFWFGWKSYKRRDRAKQAFKDMMQRREDYDFTLSSVGKIRDISDNGVSFIED